MSVHNMLFEVQEMRRRRRITKTATATLTVKEVMDNDVILGDHASAAIALTLPTAEVDCDGARCTIVNAGVAAVTIVGNAVLSGTTTAGFGGVGSGGDVITLAQGQEATVSCYKIAVGYGWYHDLHTVA